MKSEIFSSYVTGYKNILKNNKSQDFLDYKKVEDAVICSVADGHSTNFFEYSDKGAEFACKVSINVLQNYIKTNKQEVEKALQEGIIQKEIYTQWMNMVNTHYKNSKPKVFKTEYLKYSTTLISTLITESFIVYLKIGDGKIILNKDNKIEEILDIKEKAIVDSLGRYNSFNNIYYRIDNNYNNNVILCTDGYSNSFKDEIELLNSLEKTINKYNKSVFSRMILNKEYKRYLSKLSKNTSLDDISIIFIMFK